MMTTTSNRRRPLRLIWAVALMGLGAAGCGNREVGTVPLAGKQPKVYIQTVSRVASTSQGRGRRSIDRLPRKSVKQFAIQQSRSS